MAGWTCSDRENIIWDGTIHDKTGALAGKKYVDDNIPSVITDLTAGTNKVFQTKGTSEIVEIGLGAAGTYLKSAGVGENLTWDTPAGDVATDTIWDAAGDLVQGTGANTAAKLAIGAANLKLFVNAAGNGVEWAKGMKVHTITRDMTAASGDVAYTGVGFKPSIMLTRCDLGGDTTAGAWGFDDGTTATCIIFTGTYFNAVPTRSVWFTDNFGTTHQRGFIKSWDADGFTITWEKAGSPTGTASVYMLLLR